MRLIRLFVPVVVVAWLAVDAEAQESVTPYNCFPTCSEVDGRMLSLAGAGLKTLGGDFINIQIVSSGDGFEVGIFDGDNGAGAIPHWDRVGSGELGVTQLRFRLFADPDGDGTGSFEVGPPGGWFSDGVNPVHGTFFSSSVDGMANGAMPDNNWFDIGMADAPEAAANPGSDCPAGQFCYRLLVNLVAVMPPPMPPPGVAFGPNGSSESNFKVRSTGDISLRPLAFSFVGALRSFNDAAIIYPRFPDTSVSTYDGTWSFVMRVDEPLQFFSVWDGDFDYGSYDCIARDSDDTDTCTNTDPRSACFPNTHPMFPGLVPSWAVGTAARGEGIAIGNVLSCGPTTGAPNDDQNPNLLGPTGFFTRSPSVSYWLDTPVGSFFNDNPSGNQEWEQFRLETDMSQPADHHVSSLPPGRYVFRSMGLDLANLNALRMSAAVLGVPSASLGDRIWLDRNGNGAQDSGEEGINGVEVRLYRDSNGNGVLDPATDALVATQLTSGDGDYDFLGLGAADYFVDVVESTLPFDNLSLTTGNEPYGLHGGSYPLQESEDHDEADLGYVFGVVGDLVWSDYNADGLFQPEFGEVGIAGVSVRLTGDIDGDGDVDTLTTTTDSLGFYLFDQLFVPGLYEVEVLASNFAASGALFAATQTFDLDGLPDNRTSASLAAVPGGFENLAPDFGYVRPCAPCEGKVTQLTLRYLGTRPAIVEVYQHKGGTPVLAGLVGPGDYITVAGSDKKGTLGPGIDIFVDGREHTSIHTSCSRPIGPGLVRGDFLVVEAFSRINGLVCPVEEFGMLPPSPPPLSCSQCSGKVTQLTVMYTGAVPALVEVFQKKPADSVFSGPVAPGGIFTVTGTDKKGTLGTEIRIFVEGALNTTFHTSCSQPIGPGLERGEFLVVEGFSRNGGPLCPLP